MRTYIPPYSPSLPEWMRLVANAYNQRQDVFTISNAPAAGNWNSIGTAFGGDNSNAYETFGRTITGAGTLGTLTTGYQSNPELAALNGYFLNQSGKNQSTSGNDGRTNWSAVGYFKLDQQGGGDFSGITFSGFGNGVGPVGATSWLAMPAISFVNGTITAGQHGFYCNPFEVDLELGAYDAAAVGYVSNINRSVGDTANGLGAFTSGFRAQSNGTYAVDSAFSGSGLHKVGLDLTPLTYTAAKAGIAFSQGTRFYGNATSSDGFKATSYGLDWIERSASGFWNIVYNGSSIVQFNDNQFAVLKPIVLANTAPATTLANQVSLSAGTAASATAGTSGATPAQVAGYLLANLAGTAVKIPYYAN